MNKFSALATLTLCLNSSMAAQESQEMKLMGTTILKGSTPVSLGMAKSISMSTSPLGYINFQKAQKLRTWNVVWWIVGGYEIIAGGASLGAGNTIGAADLLLGGILVGITPTREKKRKYYITLGIDEYNKSLKK